MRMLAFFWGPHFLLCTWVWALIPYWIRVHPIDCILTQLLLSEILYPNKSQYAWELGLQLVNFGRGYNSAHNREATGVFEKCKKSKDKLIETKREKEGLEIVLHKELLYLSPIYPPGALVVWVSAIAGRLQFPAQPRVPSAQECLSCHLNSVLQTLSSVLFLTSKESELPLGTFYGLLDGVLFCFGNFGGEEASSPCQPAMFLLALAFVMWKINTQAEKLQLFWDMKIGSHFIFW